MTMLIEVQSDNSHSSMTVSGGNIVIKIDGKIVFQSGEAKAEQPGAQVRNVVQQTVVNGGINMPGVRIGSVQSIVGDKVAQAGVNSVASVNVQGDINQSVVISGNNARVDGVVQQSASVHFGNNNKINGSVIAVNNGNIVQSYQFNEND